jgi:prepilin-type processing-associated H-X9-DG protein
VRSKVKGLPNLVRFRSYQSDGSLNWKFVPGTGLDGYPAESNLRRDFDVYDPSSNFGFLDVSEASINQAAFAFGYDDFKKGPHYWIQKPGERHGRGANLSFLDGHVDHHRWLFTPKSFNGTWDYSAPVNLEDREDQMWLIDRTHLGQYRKRVLGLP